MLIRLFLRLMGDDYLCRHGRWASDDGFPMNAEADEYERRHGIHRTNAADRRAKRNAKRVAVPAATKKEEGHE